VAQHVRRHRLVNPRQLAIAHKRPPDVIALESGSSAQAYKQRRRSSFADLEITLQPFQCPAGEEHGALLVAFADDARFPANEASGGGSIDNTSPIAWRCRVTLPPVREISAPANEPCPAVWSLESRKKPLHFLNGQVDDFRRGRLGMAMASGEKPHSPHLPQNSRKTL